MRPAAALLFAPTLACMTASPREPTEPAADGSPSSAPTAAEAAPPAPAATPAGPRATIAAADTTPLLELGRGMFGLAAARGALILHGDHALARIDLEPPAGTTRLEGRELARPRRAPCAALVDGDTLYWTVTGDFGDRYTAGEIVRTDLRTGTSSQLVGRLASPRSLAVAGALLFWIDGHDGGLRRRGPTGAVARLADAGTGQSHSLVCRPRVAVDEDAIYYTFAGPIVTGPPTDELRRLPRAGGRPTTLLTHVGGIDTLVADATHLYWVADNPPGPSTLLRMPKAGGPGELVTDGLTFGAELVLDGPHLYWLDSPHAQGYAIRRRLRAGGPTETLVEGPRSAHALVHDETRLYWIEYGHLEGECQVDLDPLAGTPRCSAPWGHIRALVKPA